MPLTRPISHNGRHESTTGTTSRTDRSRSISEDLDPDSIRTNRSEDSGIPGWVPWAIGGIALCAIVYGLFQLESVREFANDFLSGDEFEENEYVARTQEDESDFGSGDFGSSASERLRSQL